MKSAHVRFDEMEYDWLKAVAKADRRSVSSLIELLVTAELARLHADKKPYAPPCTAPAGMDALFDDEPHTPTTPEE